MLGGKEYNLFYFFKWDIRELNIYKSILKKQVYLHEL